MEQERIVDTDKTYVTAHAKWLRGEGGAQADLRGADLTGAYR